MYLYQLILLQLENYDLRRFIPVVLKTNGIYVSPLRTKLIWTPKMKIIVVLSTVLQLFVWMYCISLSSLFGLTGLSRFALGIFWAGLLFWGSFLFLSMAVFFLLPFDVYLKRKLVAQAKSKMKEFPNTTVIGIAGSYGKTTMKEVVSQVLSEKFRIVKTPENINTPLGISQVILHDLGSEVGVFVVEMGEYYKGDIRNICQLVRPDISIVTGINEAHLERLKSLRTTVETIFEITQNMKKDGLAIANGDDGNVRSNYLAYTNKKKLILYGRENCLNTSFLIKNVTFHTDGSGISFSLQQKRKIKRIKIPCIGEYILGDILGAAEIAHHLGLTFEEIVRGVQKISPAPHRLCPVESSFNILVIDDSYNGNPNGVDEAIRTLAKFENRRKIYVTPGLVEMGEKSIEVHRSIGRNLAQSADIVLLIKNSVTSDIAKGLEEKNFPKANILWFPTAVSAFEGIKKLSGPGDVILFQNDWPENYL